MNILSLSSSALRQAIELLEQREALLQQLSEVESQLTALEGGTPAPAAPAAPAVKARKGRKAAKAPKAPKAPKTPKAPKADAAPKAGGRRKIKDEIVEMLQNAGDAGLSVGEIASRLGLGPNRVFTWFYATGKKIKAIKKMGNAQYRWVS